MYGQASGDLYLEWKDKSTLGSREQFIDSLKAYEAFSLKLSKNCGYYSCSNYWSILLGKIMNNDIRRYLLLTVMTEINRCVKNQDKFDENVLIDFYHICVIEGNLSNLQMTYRAKIFGASF